MVQKFGQLAGAGYSEVLRIYLLGKKTMYRRQTKLQKCAVLFGLFGFLPSTGASAATLSCYAQNFDGPLQLIINTESGDISGAYGRGTAAIQTSQVSYEIQVSGG